MKSFSTIAAGAAVLLAVASCQIAETDFASRDYASGTNITLTASMENGGAVLLDGEEYIPETKTSRVGTSVYWNPGDQISVFYGSKEQKGGSCFTSTAYEDSKVSNFSGYIGVITGGDNVTQDDTYFWAVYPYSELNTCNGSSVTLPLAADQLSSEGSFGKGQWPTLGKSEGLMLSFKNICCGYRFQVERDDIEEVAFVTNVINPNYLAGVLHVSMDSKNNPQIDEITSGGDYSATNTVRVKPEKGGTFKPGVYYYAVMVPGHFDDGVQMQFFTASQKGIYQCDLNASAPERPSARGAFKSMVKKDSEAEWSDRTDVARLPSGQDFRTAVRSVEGVSVDKSTDELSLDVLSFESKCKSKDLVGENIDPDGAGIYLYYEPEAETLHVRTRAKNFVAHQDCSGMLSNLDAKQIKGMENIDFQETSNFRGLLENCYYLESIDLSNMDMSSAEDIELMFMGCQCLGAIDLSGKLLPKVTSLYGVFWECYALETINLTGTEFGKINNISYAFTACRSLTSLDLSSISLQNPCLSGLKFSYAFDRCYKLSKLQFGFGFVVNYSSAHNLSTMFGVGNDSMGHDDPDGDGVYTTIQWPASTGNTLMSVFDSGLYAAGRYQFVNLFPGVFSVSSVKKVRFSPGNLQATVDIYGTPSKWRFAKKQNNYLGKGGSNEKIGLIAGDIDLFGWSTPSTNYGILMSDDPADFSGVYREWGETMGNGWRTLTYSEWQYLTSLATTRKNLYRCGVGVAGTDDCIVLYPDGWIDEVVDDGGRIEAPDWAELEAAGVVCLPPAGRRNGYEVVSQGKCGFYWTSLGRDEELAYGWLFEDKSYGASPWSDQRCNGLSVRLVADVK